MNNLFIITGGNLGDKKKNLEYAAKQVESKVGHIVQQSSIYESESWGITDQPTFYNQVLAVQTTLFPEEIMQLLLKIEEEMGRKRTIKNASRIIDIDILFFNNEVLQSKNVEIPHKEIPNRRFVLAPLNEIAPGHIHPVLNKSIHELLAECKDDLEVKKL